MSMVVREDMFYYGLREMASIGAKTGSPRSAMSKARGRKIQSLVDKQN